MVDGILSDKQIRTLIDGGAIENANPNLINPGSLDLRLGFKKWKLLGSVLPLKGQSVQEMLNSSGVVDLADSTSPEYFLAKGQPYLFELQESLNLPNSVGGRIFNKSGRGRIGISLKVLADGCSRFNHIPTGYKGKLYAEVTPTTFPITIKSGETAIPQIQFYEGNTKPIQGWELEMLFRKEPILLNDKGQPYHQSLEEICEIVRTGRLTFTADLSNDLLIYQAKQDNKTIDLSKRGVYDPKEFFEEVRATNNHRSVIIHPGEFILIHSKQNIRLPPTYTIAIAEYSEELGDMKSHYAGMINPGHAYTPKFSEDHIVFEVRARDIPILIQDNQPLAQFELFKMTETPEIKYPERRSTKQDSLSAILPIQFKKD